MSSKKSLQRDRGSNVIQCFTPTRIQAVTANVAWSPLVTDVAFSVPTNCTYKINDGALSGTLLQGAIRAIREGSTYTFNTSMSIEVM